MNNSELELTFPLDQLTRSFPLRSNKLQWFLGAGASFSSGIATAGDMIWEFKQQLYCSNKKIAKEFVEDLGNSETRTLLQKFIDGSEDMPSQGAADEYSRLFEAAFSNSNDRQAYLRSKMLSTKPSAGLLVLAALLESNNCNVVWTTNFDAMIEDSFAELFGKTSILTVTGIDNPEVGFSAISNSQWPITIKLHGDFRSTHLKNTENELQTQDEKLRKLLLQQCTNNGLIVAGYSGRDRSIMEVFEQALEEENPFPSGLFWLERRGQTPLPQVSSLITKARSKGIECGIVPIENFDEFALDLLKTVENIELDVVEKISTRQSFWEPAPYLTTQGAYPLIRTNALKIEDWPEKVRKIECDIGGHSEIQDAINTAAIKAVATRTKFGVLAFGSDNDLNKAFSTYDIKSFEEHTIPEHVMRYESSQRGLLRNALGAALARTFSMQRFSRRKGDFLIPRNPSDDCWNELKQITKQVSGEIRGADGLIWHEGVEVQIEWAEDSLWLLFDPRIVFEGKTQKNKAISADFARERTARRYNSQLDQLLTFWSKTLSNSGEPILLYDVDDGIDAEFRLAKKTAYSIRFAA